MRKEEKAGEKIPFIDCLFTNPGTANIATLGRMYASPIVGRIVFNSFLLTITSLLFSFNEVNGESSKY